MKRLPAATLIATSLIALSGAAGAQTHDVVVMRKAISDLLPVPSAKIPVVTPPVVKPPAAEETYSWLVTQWTETGSHTTCGTVHQTRQAVCTSSGGTAAVDSKCTGERPATSRDQEATSGCTTAWSAGEWSSPMPACGASSRSRTVTCARSDGTVLANTECGGDMPATSEAVGDYTACTDGRSAQHPYNWTVGAYGTPTTTCGDATRTRTVQCLDERGSAVSDSLCVGTRPESSSAATHETSGCGYAWKTGDYGDPQPACGATTRTRPVYCLRGDGTTVADGQCAGTKPDTTQAATDYGTCTYAWATTAYGPWTSTCGDATQSRTVTCQRADGATVEDARCTGVRPASTSPVSHQTTGCTYKWQEGGFDAATPACGASVQTQTVSCLRSDGLTLTGSSESACTDAAGARPATSRTTTDYTACTYSWSPSYGPWVSACSDSTTRSVSAKCVRSDGTDAADASCDPAKKPATTQTAANYAGCTYSWTASYGAWVSGCSESTTRSVSYACTRSTGQTVADSFCSGVAKPTVATVTGANYESCTYTAEYGAYGTCTANSQTKTISGCRRSTGVAVDLSYCSAQPQTVSQTCVIARTCGTFVESQAVTGITGNGVTGSIADVYASTHALRITAARSACQNAAPPQASYTLAYCQMYDGYADKTRTAIRVLWNTGTPAAKFTLTTDATTYANFATAACSGG
jgi:thrombospondin motif-containing protein 9